MGACVSKIEIYLPEIVLTNDDILEFNENFNSEKVSEKIGIKKDVYHGRGSNN